MCHESEQLLFTCTTSTKVASICASKDLSNSTGYAQYRIGLISHPQPEFSFPDEPAPPRGIFRLDSHPLPGGMDTKITFANKGYTYIIHERSAPPEGGQGFEGHSEIIIQRSGTTIGTLQCLNDDSAIHKAAYENFSREE